MNRAADQGATNFLARCLTRGGGGSGQDESDRQQSSSDAKHGGLGGSLPRRDGRARPGHRPARGDATPPGRCPRRGVAFGSTGHIAAVTVTSLVALRSPATGDGGVPAAVVVLGAALGATPSRRSWPDAVAASGWSPAMRSASSARPSRSPGSWVSFPVLLLGSLLIGFGNSANQLSATPPPTSTRRTAAPPRSGRWSGRDDRRGHRAEFVGPSGEVAMTMGLPALAGPYLVPIVLVAMAA